MKNIRYLYLVLFLIFPTQLLPQAIPSDILEGALISERAMQLIGFITILSIAPGILITVTCFPFVITVLSILRQAIGLQQSPPNLLLISLALFLTYFIMESTLISAWNDGVMPYRNGEESFENSIRNSLSPFREFMIPRVNLDIVNALTSLRYDEKIEAEIGNEALSVLIPSFLLSELSRAFQVGFILFLPFLVIDLVSAAVLMSMGMMMVPPAIVSLPFKLGFFVVADGWALLTTGLVASY